MRKGEGREGRKAGRKTKKDAKKKRDADSTWVQSAAARRPGPSRKPERVLYAHRQLWQARYAAAAKGDKTTFSVSRMEDDLGNTTEREQAKFF